MLNFFTFVYFLLPSGSIVIAEFVNWQVLSRQSNPGILAHFLNPESRDRRCFNPGISGLWKMNKMPEFYMIFARKILAGQIKWINAIQSVRQRMHDINRLFTLMMVLIQCGLS